MKRLKNKKGDTLLETLIAFTIICITIILLANTLASSGMAVKRTKDANESVQSLSEQYWTGQGIQSSSNTTLDFKEFRLNIQFNEVTVEDKQNSNTYYEIKEVKS